MDDQPDQLGVKLRRCEVRRVQVVGAVVALGV